MTAPTTLPPVTDCTARIRNGELILDGCDDCTDVSPVDVRFAEDVAAALRWCRTGPSALTAVTP
ncbi:MAG: hypothetical protein HOQ43_10755 [Glycomyces artemisiae]|uniref:Uncharacterized protein n=1 Tax=Glycomyces artemisiae TaxID=1076443 RepID=A0A850C4J5_9ACTN|nr:hypothetical protein [Glycomyces artemisiae]